MTHGMTRLYILSQSNTHLQNPSPLVQKGQQDTRPFTAGDERSGTSASRARQHYMIYPCCIRGAELCPLTAVQTCLTTGKNGARKLFRQITVGIVKIILDYLYIMQPKF